MYLPAQWRTQWKKTGRGTIRKHFGPAVCLPWRQEVARWNYSLGQATFFQVRKLYLMYFLKAPEEQRWHFGDDIKRGGTVLSEHFWKRIVLNSLASRHGTFWWQNGGRNLLLNFGSTIWDCSWVAKWDLGVTSHPQMVNYPFLLYTIILKCGSRVHGVWRIFFPPQNYRDIPTYVWKKSWVRCFFPQPLKKPVWSFLVVKYWDNQKRSGSRLTIFTFLIISKMMPTLGLTWKTSHQ